MSTAQSVFDTKLRIYYIYDEDRVPSNVELRTSNDFSDGKNVYTCFRCDFTLCVGCVKAVGGEDALATVTSAASVTARFDEGRNNVNTKYLRYKRNYIFAFLAYKKRK